MIKLGIMSFIDKSGVSLEMKLFQMPLNEMLAALELIDEFDCWVQTRVERDGNPEQRMEWEAELAKRRFERDRFRHFRLMLEGRVL